MNRYARTQVINFGKQYGTSYAISVIRNSIKSGLVRYKEIQLQENQRLDNLAGQYYGDGRLFWVIAAASNCGWALQVPPGTKILIPELESISEIVG